MAYVVAEGRLLLSVISDTIFFFFKFFPVIARPYADIETYTCKPIKLRVRLLIRINIMNGLQNQMIIYRNNCLITALW